MGISSSSKGSNLTFQDNTKLMWNVNQLPEEDHEMQSDLSSQPHRSNRLIVLALPALPHTGSKTSDNDAKCQVCPRRAGFIYSYCSESCKAKAFAELDLNKPAVDEPKNKKDNDENPNKRKRKRMGTPRRSPLS